MDSQLTGRQQEILSYLSEFIRDFGYPPSLRDICARFNISGPQNAAKHLEALEKKGFIRRRAGVSRAIELIGGRPLTGTVSVPIAGRVRAGAPGLAVEDVTGHVALDESFFRCAGAFLLRVDGESMTGAGINHGDLVVVRPQQDAASGEIVVALMDDEATVKTFVRDSSGILLRPENPSMAPITVGPESGFSIVGKVVSVIRRLEGQGI